MKRLNIGGAVVIAAAALIVGAVFGQPGNGRAAGSGPVGTAAPTISGTAQDGQVLSTTNGTWNNSPTSYAYAWSLCDASGGSCAAIATATAATYTAVSADVGHTLRITVTAKNTEGSGSATSAPSAVVSDKTAPTPTTAPWPPRPTRAAGRSRSPPRRSRGPSRRSARCAPSPSSRTRPRRSLRRRRASPARLRSVRRSRPVREPGAAARPPSPSPGFAATRPATVARRSRVRQPPPTS